MSSNFSTFTNDTGFLDDIDQAEETEFGHSTETFDEANVGESQNICIELSESITAEDIDNLLENDKDNDERPEPQQNDNSVDRETVVQSEYTGEISEITFLTEHNGEVTGGDSCNGRAEQEQEPHRNVEQIDPNYISQFPTTSSSRVDSSNQPKLIFASDKIASNQGISTASLHHSITTEPNTEPSNKKVPSKQQTLPRRETTVSTNTTPRLTINAPNNTGPQRQSGPRSSTNKTTVNSNINNIHHQPCIATSTPTPSSSNEKTIELIRNKMDSCLTAFQNKLTDKPQRSPHAPFLAYLGTKLTNVSKENISKVEEEILAIVKCYSE